MTGSVAPQIDVADAEALVNQGRALVNQGRALLLDVRDDFEWVAGHAPAATHCALAELTPERYRGSTVVVMCRSGGRSQKAADALCTAGITAVNLTGGISAWQATGRAVVRDDGSAGTVA
ncbi:rhodanese-like domain-containing protein [Arthrobacter sp. SLBN-53]|uniref:rhodanese-like domain-containing protein n=1 Tax=Arthrobacter sp. SLBN-53 TaxID=2768412 RepID=UPI00114EB0CE|nr:rhodanese-like domain-containing protein [Arthrobacter sp. SLBN-53]TQK30900.1 rhodanese-related sulfurtransferase [Arthrobacter sp. SLBN-53]